MSYIIILEGPDGTGKTTLAQRLVKDHGATYIHQGWSKGVDWGLRHLATMRRAARLASLGKPVVVDRLWLSGEIYGSVFRGKSDDRDYARLIQRIGLTHGALTVLCLPARAELANQAHHVMLGERREMYQDISKVVRFYTEVRDGLGRRWKHPTCYADVLTGPDPTWRNACEHYDYYHLRNHMNTWVTSLVCKAVEHRARQYTHALEYPNGINIAGSLDLATHLLVGEGLSPDKGLLRYPFGDPMPWAFGMWFARQLDQAGILEEHLLWTNAASYDERAFLNDYHLRRLLFLKPSLRVVALGSAAQKAVTDMGVTPALLLNHPQYQRRFKNHEPGYLQPLRADIQTHVLRKA